MHGVGAANLHFPKPSYTQPVAVVNFRRLRSRETGLLHRKYISSAINCLSSDVRKGVSKRFNKTRRGNVIETYSSQQKEHETHTSLIIVDLTLSGVRVMHWCMQSGRAGVLLVRGRCIRSIALYRSEVVLRNVEAERQLHLSSTLPIPPTRPSLLESRFQAI